MHARIVAHKAICIAGVEIPAGGVFATMEFDNALLAEFFATRLGWSWFRVELGAINVVVGTEPLSHLAEAAPYSESLAAIGISTIADLAKADAKALRPIVGAKSGELTRAAKRTLIALRHTALLEGAKTLDGKPPEAEPMMAESDVIVADLFDLLAGAAPEELAQIKGLGPKKAAELIENAQAFVAERAEAEAKAKAEAEANPS